ncbi:fibronectin type III-like domain-contianing protein [Streptomyces sp. M19]
MAAACHPFGHGLSYTSFGYADATAERVGDTVRVRCAVTDTGAVASDEVVQVYAGVVAPSVPRPHGELVAHARIRLAPGERAEPVFDVLVADLGFWDVAHGRWYVEPGVYQLLVGASSADIRLVASVEIDGTGTRPGRARCWSGPGAGSGGGGLRRAGRYRHRTTATVEVSGSGTVELALDDGPSRTRVDVPATGGRYDYTALSAALVATGVRDLRVRPHGTVRLARVSFDGRSASDEGRLKDVSGRLRDVWGRLGTP